MPNNAFHVGFVLFDGFSNMVLACLMEPLRAVQGQSDKQSTWSVLTVDDGPARSSSGLLVTPSRPCAEVADLDALVIVSGYGFRQHTTASTGKHLRALAKRSDLLIGADTGAWLLASSGLLSSGEATIHWHVLDEFTESFPALTCTFTRVAKQKQIWTCGGASTALDLMLALIAETFGPAAAFSASTLFLHDAERQYRSGRGPNYLKGKGSTRLLQAINRMVETVEEPLSLADLAASASLSLRTLNRLFRTEIGLSPGQYYQMLRLDRARDLATSTELSLSEIAVRCGFSTASSLGKAFSRTHKISIGKIRSRHEHY
ncbi:GlxA family transcriptional regulator [Granulosicoccus antarcticus]|uniref:HTH-type transcriptional regulator CdhR n=1 Tax=Granulosicoccus antarcticus IMCC3135 TaxID=1192854 RepID=A0A2Z2P0D2_9GAMM|nr:helix-turn-helix domain-containing protein [Granulosicoccus antarcticus]ASJ73627.1 HTH-type transcriptional regulator CdhR [Granulosicoccus antarcticus IMCC3135]